MLRSGGLPSADEKFDQIPGVVVGFVTVVADDFVDYM